VAERKGGGSILDVALSSLGFMLALSYGRGRFISSLVFAPALSCGGGQWTSAHIPQQRGGAKMVVAKGMVVAQ
jgi:hypothetical protein